MKRCEICNGTGTYEQPMIALPDQTVQTICPKCGPNPFHDQLAEARAARVREDDEDGPCPSCEDGCERCDPRYLRDADIDAVSNLVAAHGNADHIAAMDRLIARAVPAPTTLNGEDDG